jgi:hypothetical protein
MLDPVGSAVRFFFSLRQRSKTFLDPGLAGSVWEVGDYVDARDPDSGAWFEGEMILTFFI